LFAPFRCVLLVFVGALVLCFDIGPCWHLLVNVGVQVPF
jgi:hypothetical protein